MDNQKMLMSLLTIIVVALLVVVLMKVMQKKDNFVDSAFKLVDFNEASAMSRMDRRAAFDSSEVPVLTTNPDLANCDHGDNRMCNVEGIEPSGAKKMKTAGRCQPSHLGLGISSSLLPREEESQLAFLSPPMSGEMGNLLSNDLRGGIVQSRGSAGTYCDPRPQPCVKRGEGFTTLSTIDPSVQRRDAGYSIGCAFN